MKPAERQEARSLREHGLSVKDISKKLGVSKSSVSVWVRDIKLTGEQIDALNHKQEVTRQFGQRASYESAKVRHAKFMQMGKKRALRDDSFRLLCALYWGEGGKTQRRFFLSNADPYMLRFLIRWFESQSMMDDVSIEVAHHEANELDDAVVHDWWTSKLGCSLPIKIRRVKISRASQRKNIGKLPYGTARIELRRSSCFFFQVMGGIEYLKCMGG